MPNVMAALPNIGGALCSMPQSSADAHYLSAVQYADKTRNPLKFAECPELPDRSQPLVGRSSPYCWNIWRRYCCLTGFLRRYSSTNLYDGAQMATFLRFFTSCIFSASRVQHVSDLHPKLALRPHHVWKYSRHPVSDR